MKKLLFIIVVLLIPTLAFAESFTIKTLTKNDFSKFVKVFSEMRGPIRTEILKDSKGDFKNVDPLAYLSKVKSDKDVLSALKKNDLNWDSFMDLTGNILLSYFAIQPNETKAALIRRLSGYGMTLSTDQIPAEYRGVVESILKTKEGSELAGMILDTVIQIPKENLKLAKNKKRTLDQLFYTNFWKDKI